jgi:uncharacterized membrane protein YccC
MPHAPARVFWDTLVRFERSKIAPRLALRNAAGVALPLAAGAAMGDPGGGLIMALGALNVSFSDNNDPYLYRGRRMLAASLFCSLAVAVGGMAGESHTAAIVLSSLCAFMAAMMAALEGPAADIGTITLVTLLVFSAQAMSPQRALVAGLLALSGGLLQTVFALALWPVRRYGPERHALGRFYLELARAAEARSPAAEAPPASQESTLAQTALAGLAGDRSIDAERCLALLSQAERIRLALLALARLRVRLEREDSRAEAELLALGGARASEVLGSIGLFLTGGSPAELGPQALAELRTLEDALRAAESRPMVRDARWQLQALSGQLRSALELAGHATPHGSTEFHRREASRPWRLRLEGVLAVLRANLHLDSAVFRHALRLAACVALADALGRALDWRRAYWLPMTVAIVLKPDFGSTFARGLLRAGGTLAGLVFSTALFHLFSPGRTAEVLWIGGLTFLLRCFGGANYGVFVTALTALVVLMFAVTGVQPATVIAARGMNTLAGAAIALTAYGLWPTWERKRVHEALAGMLDAYRGYFGAVRDAYLEPDRDFGSALDRTRLAARLARSNLEASVTRLRSEPGTAARVAELETILANSHRLVHALMALEAGLARSRRAPARPAFRDFACDVDRTLQLLSAALVEGAAAALPDLRESHNRLTHSGDPAVDRYALVNVETDRVTNSLNTLAEEILRL